MPGTWSEPLVRSVHNEGDMCLGPGLSLWYGQYTMRGTAYRNIEINLKEIKESKFHSNMIAEFGVGSAEVSCRPAAQISSWFISYSLVRRLA